MRKLPPLNAVRAFEAAARHQSFTQAAAELHVTHGAVSRQVALLEQWLGQALFERARSQVQLNTAGQQFLADVTPALDRIAVAAAQTQASAAARAAPTTLQISAPPTFTMRWLIPRLSGFQKQHAAAEIKLTTSLAAVNFKSHGYDLAIRGATAPLRGCRSKAFMRETIVPVCHVDLLARGLTQAADLARHTLIGYATEPYSWADWWAAAHGKAAAGAKLPKPARALHFEQMYFALQAAAEGLGLVLVPLFLVADDILAGRLCAPFGLRGAMQRSYYANTATKSAAQSTPNPLLQAFGQWLQQEGQATEHAIEAWASGMGW